MITNNSQMTGAIGESLAAAAGYKPAPPIRQINCQTVMRHERKLTWGRRVPASAFVSQGSMP